MAADHKVTLTLGGKPIEFTFRLPKAREWMDYEAARLTFQSTGKAGTLTSAITKEMYEQGEQLAVRVVTSHTPQQLQDLNEEHLGIFLELGSEIGDVVDTVRAGAGKASPPPGGA